MKTFKEFLDKNIDEWMKDDEAIKGFQERFDEDWKDMMIHLSSITRTKEKKINEER